MSEPRLEPIQEPGWAGLWANRSTPAPPGHVYEAENYYLDDSRWSPMPGSEQLGPTLPGTPQAIAWFQRLDGAQFTVAIAGGNLYTYSYEFNTWTEVSTPSGVVIDPGATIDWCVARTHIIFTDGTNSPWRWDGESDFEVLSEAPVANGCAVYYDRIFFWDIPGFETEFQWSRPGQPAQGYEGEDQVWEFAQTDTGRVRNIIPMNDFMVVLKADSGTYIQGFSEENFQVAAVREGVSDTEGSESLFGTLIAENEPFFWGVNGPRMLQGGTRLIPMEMAGGANMLRDILKDVDQNRLGDVRSFYDRRNKHVVFLLPRKDRDEINWAVVFSRESESFSTLQLPLSWDVVATASHAKEPAGDRWSLLALADGRIIRYGTEGRRHAGEAEPARVVSTLYGRDTPHDEKRLVEIWLHGSSDNGVSRGRLSASVDGVEHPPKRLMQVAAGRHRRYRRGFNAIGATVQWRMEFADPDDIFHLEAAEIFFTASSRHARP